jgi:hypothetical protein
MFPCYYIFEISDILALAFVILQRLVDLLEEKKVHLPSILQSLGCIAQIAMPIFETRGEEIINFITKKILDCSDVRRLTIFKYGVLYFLQKINASVSVCFTPIIYARLLPIILF